MRILFVFIISASLCLQGITQHKLTIDSLMKVYNSAIHDTTRIKMLNEEIGYMYEIINTDSAILFYKKAIELADKNIKQRSTNTKTFLSLKATSLRYTGIVYIDMGNFDKALDYYLKALKIFEVLGNKDGQSSCYTNIGNVYNYKSNYTKAIEYFTMALKIFQELNDNKGMSMCYTNLGSVMATVGNYDKSIEYFLLSLRIKEEFRDKKGVSTCYNNIGVVHKEQGNFDKAIEYFSKSLEIDKEIGNMKGMSYCYTNIGNVYKQQGNFNDAIDVYLKALKIFEEIGDKMGQTACYGNIGIVCVSQGSFDEAIDYYQKSLKINEELGFKEGVAQIYVNIASLNTTLADSAALTENQRLYYINKAIEYGIKSIEISMEIKALPRINDAAKALMEAYKKNGNLKKAIEYAEIYIMTKDSMFNQDKTKALTEMGTKYESEKKQLEVEKMQKQKELDNKTIEAQQAENRKQLIIIISSIIGFLIVLIFSIVVLRMFSQKRKANILLAIQKQEIEEKNKDILDSITYAKRIQSAILPPSKIVKEYLKESFILYKPKDIVAGDFYWMEHKDGKILFAAADCTGHGVPGAMVSVVCNNGLNRAVREHGLTEPGKILDKTKEIVIQEFEKSEEDVKDGMDIALCSLEGKKLQYAGAHNPLWIIRNGEILEIKADKQPIGKFWKTVPFTTHTIDLQNGDTIYIFSDGYVDQFGGQKGKKFKSIGFKELLLNIQDKTMEEQRLLIDENFENWRGNLDQIDDVCIIGVKV